jgi:DNA (cytosine-5)-methyltransferase 1
MRSVASTPGSRAAVQTADFPGVVSLFCGAGGLDWGFARAGFRVRVAIDKSSAAIRTHKTNFPTTDSRCADLNELSLGALKSAIEKHSPPATRIGIIGGPPCQGFSRANTGSRADDPRNRLPMKYLGIVKYLQRSHLIDFVVFENVLGMRDKKHAPKYRRFKAELARLGFVVSENELCALDFGVPQARRRIVLVGLRQGCGYLPFLPIPGSGLKTVREAIEGLEEPQFFRRGLTPSDIPVHRNHWTMMPKSVRFANPSVGSRDGRSFKRLEWDKPSPTIAFGNREIHVHPSGHRRLSILEAMLLQGFPRSFVLEGNLSEQVEQVSNAVPPPLALSLAKALKHSLSGGKR